MRFRSALSRLTTAPLTPSSNRPEILDAAALGYMTRAVDADYAQTILQIFRDELDGLALTLGNCLRGGDEDGARRIAHTLKSAAAQVGATALAELCRGIERDPIADGERLATEFAQLVAKTRIALDHETAALGRSDSRG